MFSFTRFYLRVLADLNEIIRQRKRNVILTIAIKFRILIIRICFGFRALEFEFRFQSDFPPSQGASKAIPFCGL